MNTDYLTKHVADVEQDMGLRLITNETAEDDVAESPEGWDGDQVSYSSQRVREVSLTAIGFQWDHPRGGLISGNFAKPIDLAEATVDENGDLIEFKDYSNAVALAIVTKLGAVSEIDDVLLGMAANARKSAAVAARA